MRLLYRSGLLHAIGMLRKHFGRKRLVVLMYHRIAGPQAAPGIAGLDYGDAVPAERFASHLRLLRWFGLALPLDDAYRRLRHDDASSPRTLIAVTFDDGYRDNYLLARPLWLRHRVPVTVFPALAAVAGDEPLWWDELLRIIGSAEWPAAGARSVLDKVRARLPIGAAPEPADAHDRMSVVGYLLACMTRLTMADRARTLDDLARLLQVPGRGDGPQRTAAERRYMSWDELAVQAREGVHVGGHTIGHPRLPLEEPAVAEREIAGCRRILEEKLHTPVRCFAYPGGFYGAREAELVARAGYHVAVTVEKGVNYADTHPYRLRRIGLSWDGPHHLAFKLAFGDWLFR